MKTITIFVLVLALGKGIGAESWDQEALAADPGAGSSIEVLTVPDGVDVFLDGDLQGRSNLTLHDLQPRAYRLRLEKKGYVPLEKVMTVLVGTNHRLRAVLDRSRGTWTVEGGRPGTEVSVDRGPWNPLPMEPSALDAGPHAFQFRLFGFKPVEVRRDIEQGGVTVLALVQEPANQEINAVTLSRQRVNPLNPGSLGTVDLRCEVTAPGEIGATIQNARGDVVYTLPSQDLETWNQSLRVFPGPDPNVADGDYTVILVVKSHGASEEVRRTFTVDQDFRIRFSPLESGLTGLAQVPDAAGLPWTAVQARIAYGLGSSLEANPQAFSELDGHLVGGLPGHVELGLEMSGGLKPQETRLGLGVSLKQDLWGRGLTGWDLGYGVRFRWSGTAEDLSELPVSGPLDNHPGFTGTWNVTWTLNENWALLAAPGFFWGPEADWNTWVPRWDAGGGLRFRSGTWLLGLSEHLSTTDAAKVDLRWEEFLTTLEGHFLVPESSLYCGISATWGVRGADQGLKSLISLEWIF